MSRRCHHFGGRQGLIEACTSSAWTNSLGIGGVHRLLNRKEPFFVQDLIGIHVQSIAGLAGRDEGFLAYFRGSLTWCVPLKGSLRRSLIVTIAPRNSRRGSV